MTAMKQRKSEGATSPSDQILSRAMLMQDRKFAFLNQITRPDYRAVENEMTISNAPIATPEEEELSEEDLDEAVVVVVVEAEAEEKENREIEQAEKIVVSPVESKESKSPVQHAVEEQELDSNQDPIIEETENPVQSEIPVPLSQEEAENEQQDESNTIPVETNEEHEVPIPTRPDTLDVTPAREVLPEESPLEEEIRRMTESFGEPRKAVLERVVDVEDDESDDEETIFEEPHPHQQRDTNTLLPNYQMVFGCVSGENSSGSSCGYEKPTSLNLQSRLDEPEDTEETTPDSPLPPATDDETVLQQSLVQLQKQLRKSDVRSARLEKICQLQQGYSCQAKPHRGI